MLFEPRAADMDPVDLESALLRTAVGDYTAEAAILLLANAGYWLPALATADLIAVRFNEDPTAPPAGEVLGVGWAAIAWTDLDAALHAGRIEGSSGQWRILRAAASIADGQPVDLGDVASGLDRRHLQLLLAAISHAGGSHEHRPLSPHGFRHRPLPPLLAWPPRD
ncbi:hypothetical protein [Klenkia sp. PcliD-1-E]|uniref:hypothetical protein n=1 Tax=Klenkia sp. PcliD-1-E TaxID=2954492 RepID=UPI002097E52E|nr:hypothetical protein [Klenkia sp. PcliD-1-E]MCO7218374.1 hypothetical protein [Klenkia sp. PcliD-1-E]